MLSQIRHHWTQLKIKNPDTELVMWSVDKTFEVGIPKFKASSYFILAFKNEYKITSRQKMHPVKKKKRNLFTEIFLLPITDEFRNNFQK